MANPSPSLTFTANLSLKTSEKIGPTTNEVETTVLHPDMHQNSPDQGTTDKSYRVNNISTWFPGLTGAENRELTNGGFFTAYGQRALYLRDMYGINYAPSERAYLTVS